MKLTRPCPTELPRSFSHFHPRRSWRSALPFAAHGLLWLLLWAAACPLHALTLRQQIVQHGDFILVGNTLGQDAGPGVVAPLTGTVGSAGTNTADTGVDVWWRSDDVVGTATADTSITPAQARSTCILTVPEGATVTHAYLYWGTNQSDPGTTVKLERSDVFSTSVGVVTSLGGPAGSGIYHFRADVTTLVRQRGSGAYRLAGCNLSPAANVNHSTMVGAWTLLVIYDHPAEPVRSITIYDGADYVFPENDSSFSRLNLSVSANPIGRLGVVAYDGDDTTNGDSLSLNGIPLSDEQNPASNFFNFTRSRLGQTDTNPGDLPRLTGGPRSMSGLDADVVDITGRLTPQAINNLTFTAATTGDSLVLGMAVLSVTIPAPDFAAPGSFYQFTDPNGGAIVGDDEVLLTFTAQNDGTDGSGATRVTATIPAGTSFVPGSVRVGDVPQSDATGDDLAEFQAGTQTVVARLGTGANAAAGGALAIGASATVTFRVKVGPEATTLSSTATLRTAASSIPSQPYNIIFTASTSVAPAITEVAPASGPTAGGTLVTLTGTGFTGATAVLFGETPATTFSVNSGTSIQAVAPAHASGKVPVSVTTPSGSSPGPAAIFTYQSPAIPAVNDTVATGTGASVVYPLANDPLPQHTIASVSDPSVTILPGGRAVLVPPGFTGSFTYLTTGGTTATVNITTGTPQPAASTFIGLLRDGNGAVTGWARATVSGRGSASVQVRRGQAVASGRFAYNLTTGLGTGNLALGAVSLARETDGTLRLSLGSYTGLLRPTRTAPEPEKHHVALASIDPAIPGGGFLVANLTPRSGARLSGLLPDGRPFTASTAPSDNGTLAFYVPQTSGLTVRGLVMGELVPGDLAATDVTGELHWIKPTQTFGAKGMHLDGVNTVLTANGSRYQGVISLSGEATLTLSGSSFTTPESSTVTVTGGLPPRPTGALVGWGSVRATIGKFTPRVRIPGVTRPVTGSGVYLPKSRQAWGYFPGLTTGGRIDLQLTPE